MGLESPRHSPWVPPSNPTSSRVSWSVGPRGTWGRDGEGAVTGVTKLPGVDSKRFKVKQDP